MDKVMDIYKRFNDIDNKSVQDEKNVIISLYEGKSKYQKILVFSKYKFKNKKLKICY